jgi:protein tyrosine/serine phosphatase
MPRRLRQALKRRLVRLSGSRALSAAAGERPPHWAQRLAVEGVDNLHRVSENLYRSAQPSMRGMQELRSLGIRSVINLRAFHCDLSGSAGTGLSNHRLHILTWKVQDVHVVRVLGLLRDVRNAPFLIHCKHGADRTGLMLAMYRIVEQGWSKQDAISEMVNGGYGYHRMWRNILRYIERVDVEHIRVALNRARGFAARLSHRAH